jgi:hypothetical protein
VGSVAGVLFAVGLLSGLIFVVRRPAAAPLKVETAPVGTHQIVLHNWPDKPWITYSRAHTAFLGDPIWGEQSYQGHADCVGYENAVVCTTDTPQTANTVYQFQPLPLGMQSLSRTRTVPDPGAAVAAIVQQYFDHRFQDAVDQGQDDFTGEADLIAYWFGRPEGSVTCVSGPHSSPGQCLQVFERQVLRWPEGSNDPNNVQLWPLGTEAPRP